MVESNKNRVEIWEPKEAYYSLHTQEVKWKIRIAGTGIEKVQIDRDPIVQWTVAEPLVLRALGLPFSEKQIPQVVEKLESGGKPKKLWSVRYAPNGRCAVRKQVSSMWRCSANIMRWWASVLAGYSRGRISLVNQIEVIDR